VSSREDNILHAGGEVDYPDCNALHVVDYLFQIGPIGKNGAVTHTDIKDWQENTGVELDAWESRTIRQLSVEYIHEITQNSPTREAPYTTEKKVEFDRQTVAKKIKDSIGQRLR